MTVCDVSDMLEKSGKILKCLAKVIRCAMSDRMLSEETPAVNVDCSNYS